MLAAAGYAVVAANPRGSSGYGTAFSRAIWADWGNKDYEDVMAAVDHVVAMGVADPDRLGVGGWSYGGILTDYVITKTGRFKAAISGASEANYLSNYGTDHYQYEWETELGLPWRNVDRWVKLSPWFAIENVTTPTLLMGGADDINVPLAELRAALPGPAPAGARDGARRLPGPEPRHQAAELRQGPLRAVHRVVRPLPEKGRTTHRHRSRRHASLTGGAPSGSGS